MHTFMPMAMCVHSTHVREAPSDNICLNSGGKNS